MNHAIWKLNFDNSEYGTGPEDSVAALGAKATGAFSISTSTDSVLIVGYVDSLIDSSQFGAWDFAYITKEEALAYAISANPQASMKQDGLIIFPMPEMID